MFIKYLNGSKQKVLDSSAFSLHTLFFILSTYANSFINFSLLYCAAWKHTESYEWKDETKQQW